MAEVCRVWYGNKPGQMTIEWSEVGDLTSWSEPTNCGSIRMASPGVIRKLDSTTLRFTKLPEGRMEIFGAGVATETESKIILMPGQVFEVYLEEGKIFLAVRDRSGAVPPLEEPRRISIVDAPDGRLRNVEPQGDR